MSKSAGYIRSASHAGSWYEENPSRLARMLDEWLDVALEDCKFGPADVAKPLGVIAPHAGYRYSGPTAAYAYTFLDGKRAGSTATSASGAPSYPTRIVILGPSHHAYIDGCAIPGAVAYATPLGNLAVDRKLADELMASGHFKAFKQAEDEDEHSLEMHLPYIVRALQRHSPTALEHISILPIVVGRIARKERKYAELLAPIIRDPNTFVVVSSDFCHWGRRFDFMTVDEEAMRAKPGAVIADGIEALDKRGMDLIASRDFAAFHAYLEETENTICGRHPIEILLLCLDVVDPDKKQATVKFVKYAQSSRVSRPDDSSVSYASAAVHMLRTS